MVYVKIKPRGEARFFFLVDIAGNTTWKRERARRFSKEEAARVCDKFKELHPVLVNVTGSAKHRRAA